MIIALMLINLCSALFAALLERRNPSSTVAWFLVILLIPLVGPLLYLFFGRTPRTRSQFVPGEAFVERAAGRAAEQRQQLEADRLPGDILPYGEMILTNLMSSGALLTLGNVVKVLGTGSEYFEAMIAGLEKAEKFIYLEVYIFRPDKIGRRILEILTAKAEQGLSIRVLYDGTGSMGLTKKALEPLIEAGGQAAPFLPPLKSLRERRINYRDHRKICVIDGADGFLGGFNIGIEYLEGSPSLGFWRDLHIQIHGPAVERLELRFIMDWYFATDQSIQPSIAAEQLPKAEGGTAVQIVTSGPASHWIAIKYAILRIIQEARHHLYIETPYFMPDQALLDALKIKALAGVTISIIIPSKPDHPFVQWANLSFCGELLEAGVRVYTYRKGFLHSKLVTADGAIGSVGAANFDLRSFYVNFEVTAVLYDPGVVQRLEALAEQDIRDSTELTLARYQSRPWSTKAREAFCRMLAPLL